MIKYAKIINSETKEVCVGTGKNSDFYQKMNMQEMDVEQSFNGSWYLTGFAPQTLPLTYSEKRQAEYPDIAEQLDMIFWDKVNGTNLWQEKIAEIKAKYPKE